jgi:hypothetical protein
MKGITLQYYSCPKGAAESYDDVEDAAVLQQDAADAAAAQCQARTSHLRVSCASPGWLLLHGHNI